jgi:hypothetical protein
VSKGKEMGSEHTIKLSWEIVRVCNGEGSDLSGMERLAVLVLWLRGENPPECQFFDPVRVCTIADPLHVNWARFPVQEALEAAASHTSFGNTRIRIISPRWPSVQLGECGDSEGGLSHGSNGNGRRE